MSDTTQASPAPTTAPTTGSQSSSGGSSSGSPSASSSLKRGLAGASYDVQAKMLTPVQKKGGEDTAAVHEAAAQGIQGGGGAMPYASQIQKSFGSHDIGGIQAHSGSGAAKASKAMGAEAYATGNHVVFGGAPSLHTAAHEAAHVVQQQSGVSLSGGVGKSGDKYENHADKVADAVVSGKSAEPILNEMTGGGAKGTQKKATQARSIQRLGVQRTVVGAGPGPTALPSDGATSGPAWGAPAAAVSAEEATFTSYLSNPLAHPTYTAIFLPRVQNLFRIANMDAAGAPAMAQQAWTAAFQAIGATEALLPSITVGGRVDLAQLKTKVGTATTSAIEKFEPLNAAVTTALTAQFATCRSFAFWSKPVAMNLAMNGGADMALETSALGGLFNGLNLTGDFDIQLWAGLSAYYARAIVNLASAGKEVRVFCGPGAAKDNIYAKIEFPELEAAFNAGTVQIINYAVAPLVEVKQADPAVPTSWAVVVTESQPDYAETGGSVPGTYAQLAGGMGSRSTMIDEANSRFAAKKLAAQAEADRKNVPPPPPPPPPPS